jgi:hypothetical protein
VPNRTHQLVENATPSPAQEITVDCAFPTEVARPVVSLGRIVENPENALEHLPLERRRSAAFGTAGRIQNLLEHPAELFVG